MNDEIHDDYINEIGSKIEQLIPGGTNVEFVYKMVEKPNSVFAYVWERGVGRTLACGSGACAVGAVCLNYGVIMGDNVNVFMEGSQGKYPLNITLNQNEVLMKGPATKVYEGKYIL